MTKKVLSHETKVEIIAFVLVLFALILLTVGLSTQHLLAHQKSNYPVTVDTCQTYGTNHFVYIKDNRFYPREIEAKLCDIITIVNHDKYRLIAFGEHDEHVVYNGRYEEPLKKDSSLNVVLNKTGNYMYHDHLQDYVYGTFSVEE